MNGKFITLPITSENLIKNQIVEKCDIKESISNYLHLLLTSSFGECDFDTTFGCEIWDMDFNNVVSNNKLKYAISDSLIKSIKDKEKRLSNIEVIIEIEQQESSSKNKATIKKRVYVITRGVIRKTNEDFEYREDFYIGPLSY